jgi:predicted SprT family Zn-dependent metalloprotease
MNHATVKIGDYTIPLVGVPVSATEMECELCHNVVHITKVHLNEEGNQFLCLRCRINLVRKID